MTPFPWKDAIGFGLGVLRLPSREFWAMTPRELAFAIRAVRGDRIEPIARAALQHLLARFPHNARQRP